MSGLTGSGFGVDLLEDVEVSTTDNGDHDRFSHYVHKDDAMRGMVEGVPIMALCGKVWVPSRDGSKFPVCPECKEVFESIPEGGDGE